MQSAMCTQPVCSHMRHKELDIACWGLEPATHAPLVQQDLIAESEHIKHPLVGEEGMGADRDKRELREYAQTTARIATAGDEQMEDGMTSLLQT